MNSPPVASSSIPAAPVAQVAEAVKAMQAKCRDMKMTWNNGYPPNSRNVVQFKREIKDLAANSFPTGQQWVYDLLTMVEKADSVEELRIPILYPQFECAFNICLSEIVNKRNTNEADRLFQEVARLKAEYERKQIGRLNSLQLLWLIYDNCKYRAQGEGVYNMNLVMNIRLGTGNPAGCSHTRLRKFLFDWDQLMLQITTTVPDDLIYTCFYRQVADVGFLSHDIRDFDRLPEADRNYDRLYKICRYNIEVIEAKENQRQHHSGDTGTSRPNSPGMPAVTEGETEAYDAAPAFRKGKSRSRSNTPPRGRKRVNSRDRNQKGKSSSRSHHRLRTRSLPKSPGSVRRRFRTRSAGNRDLCMDYMMTRRCKFSNGQTFCKKSHHPRRRSVPLNKPPPISNWRSMRTPSPNSRAKISAASAVCFNFQKNGTCEYGDRCKYAHGEKDNRKKDRGKRDGAAAPPAAPVDIGNQNNTASAQKPGTTPSKETGGANTRRDSPCPDALSD